MDRGLKLSLMIEKRQLVIPGDLLAEGAFNPGNNTYRDGEKIYAAKVGLANYVGKNIYVVALNGRYMPRPGDFVIGTIMEVRLSNWNVDINSPYIAVLFASEVLERSYNPRKDEMSRIFDRGDLVLAKIISHEVNRDPILTVREPGLGRVSSGQLIRITPAKTPRLIGRKGSMISIIKKASGANITVGQNGLVLINGKTLESENLAISAIRKVEEESHTQGLTDRMNDFIKKRLRSE